MHRTFNLVLYTTIIFLVLVSVIVPSNSHAEGLGGTWEGQVTQNDPPLDYPMEMNLYGNKGNTNYPSIPCGGNLEYLRTDGRSFWYREHITSGMDKCIDGGIIQLQRLRPGDNTTWDWRWEGGGIITRGVIHGSGVAEAK